MGLLSNEMNVNKPGYDCHDFKFKTYLDVV